MAFNWEALLNSCLHQILLPIIGTACGFDYYQLSDYPITRQIGFEPITAAQAPILSM